MNQRSNTRLIRRLALLLAAATLATGCASTAPQFDRQFGNSVRAAVASQTADPGAARNTNPVAGMDGAAASAAHMMYVGSYAGPTKAAPSMMQGGAK